VTVYRFVERERAVHHLATLCRVLGVSRAGFHAWACRPQRQRAAADAALTERIRAIHAASRGTYGAPRVHAELQEDGLRVGRKRVARLMRAAGLVGVHRRRRRRADPRPVPRATTTAPDLVQRRFSASAPDRLWVADITELPTAEGAVYLAAIVDVFSRACVGWSMADHLRTSLVLTALEAAIERRRPQPGLIHHSDRGTQYTSVALGARLARSGIAASMGMPGSGLDNALAESFFASLETELIDRSTWPTRAVARDAVFDWIERFYNRVRIHSAIGYLSPAEFERRYLHAIVG
jgi:transposase InsO family protein